MLGCLLLGVRKCWVCFRYLSKMDTQKGRSRSVLGYSSTNIWGSTVSMVLDIEKTDGLPPKTVSCGHAWWHMSLSDSNTFSKRLVWHQPYWLLRTEFLLGL